MVLGLGGLIIWTGQRLAAQSIQQQEHELELQAQIIANALRDPVEHPGPRNAPTTSGRSLDSLVASYALNIAARVTLLDPNFQVVQSSDDRVPVHMEAGDPELLAARDGTEHHDIRWDEWGSEERLFVAAPVIAEHAQPIGYVQLSVSMTPLYAQIAETWLSLIGVGALVLLLTILASTLLARQIAIPIQHLTATSEQIAAGRLDERVAPAGPDEVRRLGVAFNAMAERVQDILAKQRAFVDNAAHELRSPLTSLRLRVEMLQAHGAQDPELSHRYLGQMEREIGYLQ